MQAIFWWDKRGGTLSVSSSMANFQLVFNFLEQLHLAEETVPSQESCTGQLKTCLKCAHDIW
jgi:hypothetical protein